MSAVNENIISDLVYLLQSDKIKERNEGLNKLEQFGSQSLDLLNRLSLPSLNAVINASFKTILIDKITYTRSRSLPNHAIEDRLTKASAQLRIIISKIRDGKLRKKFKFKSYLSILTNIIDCTITKSITGQDEVFEPVSLNLLKVFNILLELGEFRAHLLNSDRVYITEFVLKSLHSLLQDSLSHISITTDKDIVELLQALNTICFPDTDSVPNFVTRGNSKFYSRFFAIMNSFYHTKFLENKKESLSLILIFRLINQLLIHLSVRNIKLCHRFIRLAVRFFNDLNFISFDSLREQIVKLVNIMPSFVNLTEFPRQEGDNWILDDKLQLQVAPTVQVLASSTDKSEEIVSSETSHSTFDKTDKESSHIKVSTNIPIYDELFERELKVFNTKLLSLMTSTGNEFRLHQKDVNLKIIPETNLQDLNWFNFQFFNLKHDASSAKGWLLNRGTCRLLCKYFELKNAREKNSSDLPSKFNETSNKRRRLDTNSRRYSAEEDFLGNSSGVVEFIFKLVNYSTNDLLSLAGLQLLAFYLGSGACISQTSNDNLPRLLTEVLNTFELQDVQVSYWTLICCKLIMVLDSHLSLKSNQKQEALSSEIVNRCLRYALDMLKTPALTEAASSLVCTIIESTQSDVVKWSLDSHSLKQFDTLVQLSEINGPTALSRQTMFFWLTAYNFSNTLKTNTKRQHLSKKIQDWLISRWDQLSSLKDLDDISILSIILSWLCGAQDLFIDAQSVKESRYIYRGELMLACAQWYDYRELRAVILQTLDEEFVVFSGPRTILSLETISVVDEDVEILWNKIIKFGDQMLMFYNNGDRHKRMIYHWVSMLVSIKGNIKPHESSSTIRRLDFQIGRILDDELSGSSPVDGKPVFELLQELNDLLLRGSKNSLVIDFWKSIPMETVLEASLQQINSLLDNYSGTEKQSFKGFGTVKRVINSNSNYASASAEVPVYYRLKYFDPPEKRLLEFVVNSQSIFQRSPLDTLKAGLDIVSKFFSNAQILIGLHYLVSCTENQDATLGPLVEELIMLFAERLLSSFEFERNELMCIVGCEILTRYRDFWCHSEDTHLKSDCSDVFKFIQQLVDNQLVDTELSVLAFQKMALKVLQISQQVDDNLFEKVIQGSLETDNNYSMVSLADDMSDYLQSQDNDSEKSISYNKIQELFPMPQQSIESAASYCYFLSRLCKCSFQLLPSFIFNLIELSHFEFIVPYINYALAQMYLLYKVGSPLELFKVFRVELFNFWRGYNLGFKEFPFKLFGFELLLDFISTNYKELLALNVVFDSDPEFLEDLANNCQDTDRATVIADSLPLIIAVGYTEKSVRHNVLNKIRSFFSSESSFEAELARQAPLIVFELLKFSDVSKQEQLQKIQSTVQGDLRLFSIEIPMQCYRSSVSISPVVTLDAIQTIISKVSPSFWSLPTVYFLTRKLLFSLDESVSDAAKISYIRRIKFLMTICPDKFHDPDLVQVIVSQLSVYLTKSSLQMEICPFLVALWEDCSQKNPALVLLTGIVSVMSRLTSCSKSLTRAAQDLVKWISKFISENLKSDEESYIISTAVEGLLGRTPEVCIRQLEKDLNSRCDTIDESPILDIVSYLLQHFVTTTRNVVTYKDRGRNDLLAKKLMLHDKHLSREFMIWKANYLGKYYSETGEIPDLDIDEPVCKLVSQYQANFFLNIATLDNVFLEMRLSLSDQDLNISLSIEYVLGVIIHRNETRDDDRELLKYKENFQQCEKSIMKMDLHMCILLMNSWNTAVTPPTTGIEEVVNSMDDLIRDEQTISADHFIAVLTLSITNELAPITSLARLISCLISHIPSVAKKVFSHLLMFYIYSTKNGDSRIANLITSFYSRPRSSVSRDSKRLFIELVLLLRVGLKKQVKKFVSAYKDIDVKAAYHDAIDLGFPQTALMIMEDHFLTRNSDPASKWQDERTFLKNVYESLDDYTDLIYGLPVEPSFEYGMSILSRNKDDLWKTLLFNSGLFDTTLASGDSSAGRIDMVSSTLNVGLNGLSKMVDLSVSQGGTVTTTNDSASDESFEWAWKLNQWNIPASRHDHKIKSENGIIYKTLKLMHDSPPNALEISRDSLCELILQKDDFLKHKHQKEFMLKIRSWLRSLSTISNMDTILCDSMENLEIPSEWFKTADFSDFENILLGRKAVYEFLSSVPDVPGMSKETDYLISTLYELSRHSEYARLHGQSQKSINSAIYFNDLVNRRFVQLSERTKLFVSKSAMFQMASTFWDQGETGFPVVVLKEMIRRERKRQLQDLNKTKSDSICSKFPQMDLNVPYISALLVKWSSESRQESSSVLMDKYLEDIAADMVDESTGIDSRRAEIYHHFATFCNKYLKENNLGQIIKNLSLLIMTKNKELQLLKDYYDNRRNSKEERNAAKSKYVVIHRIRMQDKEELLRLTTNRNRFVENAVTFYLRCISISDEYDDMDVDRLCGLWLEYSSSDNVNWIVGESLPTIASYKWIPWVSQLLSRLGNEPTAFQRILLNLLEKMSFSHPYHCLYLVKSLKVHLNVQNSDPTIISRATAAAKLWRSLAMKSLEFSNNVLTPIETLCDESVDLANEKFPKGSEFKISKLRNGKFWLQSLAQFAIPPPTMDIPVQKTGNYDSIPHISSVDVMLRIASSGISRPKIMTFILSNGQAHKTLFKGGTDDLRQDAIMIQVFEKVNKIFQNYGETRKRNLRIRTYKVVPLGPQTGIIEHVLNSVTLNDILRPLHEKQDKLKIENARSLMKKVEKSSSKDRVNVYHNIMEKVRPVMGSYFFDNYLTPNDWFNTKLTYTRGVSTTSFVGYILGLGDRHTNNILLDKSTGEPVHIDFGISFDQGKRLPIPETVPFRLTRDIVDGFGITGVEGCFIKTSEHVLKVLRLESERIMDVLNILKYDPLYSWTLSPIRKQRLEEQGDMNAYQDIEATDAIEGVRNKLNSHNLSDEATVRELTLQAMDPDRLACIYLGWSPFY